MLIPTYIPIYTHYNLQNDYTEVKYCFVPGLDNDSKISNNDMFIIKSLLIQ